MRDKRVFWKLLLLWGWAGIPRGHEYSLNLLQDLPSSIPAPVVSWSSREAKDVTSFMASVQNTAPSLPPLLSHQCFCVWFFFVCVTPNPTLHFNLSSQAPRSSIFCSQLCRQSCSDRILVFSNMKTPSNFLLKFSA